MPLPLFLSLAGITATPRHACLRLYDIDSILAMRS